MRRFFAGLAILQAVAFVAQFFLAASGAFDTAPNDESFQPHRALGFAVILLACVVTVVAAIARTPGRIIGMSGLVAGLAVVQVLISTIASALEETGGSGTAGELVFGLHAVNGLALLALAVAIVRRAGQLTGPAVPARPAS